MGLRFHQFASRTWAPASCDGEATGGGPGRGGGGPPYDGGGGGWSTSSSTLYPVWCSRHMLASLESRLYPRMLPQTPQVSMKKARHTQEKTYQ
jgi:hypothetical protein